MKGDLAEPFSLGNSRFFLLGQIPEGKKCDCQCSESQVEEYGWEPQRPVCIQQELLLFSLYLDPQLYLQYLNPEIFYFNLFKIKFPVCCWSEGGLYFQLPRMGGYLTASYINMNQSLFSPHSLYSQNAWCHQLLHFWGTVRYKSGWFSDIPVLT